VIALADDDAVGRYDDRADERIGARAPEAAGGVKQRALRVRRFLRRAAGLDHHFSSKRPSTYSFASKGTRSSMPSPTPTYRIGSFRSLAIATATPPLAVPSSLVSTMPFTPAAPMN